MPAVAPALLAAERTGRNFEWIAVALPVVDPTGERGDVLVTELLERLRREGGSIAGCAVDDDLPAAVRRCLLDPRLQPAAGDVLRAGEMSLVPFLPLTDVQEERRGRSCVAAARGRSDARTGSTRTDGGVRRPGSSPAIAPSTLALERRWPAGPPARSRRSSAWLPRILRTQPSCSISGWRASRPAVPAGRRRRGG